MNALGRVGAESSPPPRDSLIGSGLDLDSSPLHLMARGNAGHWSPEELDFREDARQWGGLDERYRRPIEYFVTMFAAGEETVTAEILPFVTAMSDEGRLGDALYLTQFAYEEARHTVAFHRWLATVGMVPDLAAMRSNQGYTHVFADRLPAAMRALTGSTDPSVQLRASLTYHQVAEGTMALSGYFGISTLCESLGVLPGLRRLIRCVSGDERRHIAWGTHTCRRLLDGTAELRALAVDTLDDLEPAAVSAFEWVFDQMRGSPLKFARGRVVGRVRENADRRRAALGLREGGAATEPGTTIEVDE